jgi:hypothetical protein
VGQRVSFGHKKTSDQACSGRRVVENRGLPPDKRECRGLVEEREKHLRHRRKKKEISSLVNLSMNEYE